ncbi:hypothetical protein GCM10022243_25030 [Saccharothrix violaceirubra]|uniref:Uncharacterized protein n=1 Tax=Saccharothrix violaceirubra TaxID=413306 RepID=A0A7W7T8J9_9PSEU|nr:hypothetical protein [Saccharothrix violaceirubra]MBB4967947.1 hypothetical protein [Saccharothrix violaceirubra]
MQGDLDELNGSEEHAKKIEQGATAIRSIVSSRMQMAKVKKSLKPLGASWKTQGRTRRFAAENYYPNIESTCSFYMPIA